MNPADIHQSLVERFGDEIRSFRHGEHEGFVHAQPRFDVSAEAVPEVCRFLRDECGFDRLMSVSGVDYEGIDEKGKGKHIEISRYEEDGTVEDREEGTGDLEVVYHLHSREHSGEVAVAARLPRDNPRVATVTGLWSTAEWGERETYDFYGIVFEGHPDLRRILLPEDWEGWPLRKDYKMPTLYHDVPLEGAPYAVREQREEER